MAKQAKPVVHVVDNVREPTQNLANYLNNKFADITYSTTLHEAGNDPQTECIIMFMLPTNLKCACDQIRIYVDYANSKVTGQYGRYQWFTTWWSGTREFGSLKILENWVIKVTQKRMDQLPTEN